MIDVSKLVRYVSSWDKYKKGDVVFYDGVPSNDKMYILIEGRASVYKNYGQQGELCFAVLEPGDFFGEMSLFLDRERTATIVATENVSLFAINRVDVIDFLTAHPEITFSFLKTLCARLDLTNVNAAINLVRYEQGLTVLNQGLNALNDENRKLELAASADPLTGVSNRRFFMENAVNMIGTPLLQKMNSFIVFFDLDHFKKVNDTYGHDAGDRILIFVADIVKKAIRPSDIFARYGGEEFIMLANCERSEDILVFVERLRASVAANPMNYNGESISITASFGIAPITSGSDLDMAILQADQALYIAKNEGRNRVRLYKSSIQEQEGE